MDKMLNWIKPLHNKVRKYRSLLLIFLVSIVLVIGILYLFGLWNIKRTVKNYYAEEGEQTFVSNYDIVKSDSFKYEMDIIDDDLNEPKVAIYYKGHDYRGLDDIVITDFFYLKRKNLLFWEVKKYESSYVPYYSQDGYTLDDAYDEMKKNVKDGEVTHGLTPDQERDLLNDSEGALNTNPDDLVDYIQTPNQEKTIEVLAGEKYGTNYLLDTSTNEKLGIENIVRGVFSTDGKYLIYTTGEFIEPLGELISNVDIWVYDFKNEPKKIYEVTDKPNDLVLYSDGKVVVYGTKNSIGMINIDGNSNNNLLSFTAVDTSSQFFVLPEFKEQSNSVIRISVPSDEYNKDKGMKFYTLNLNTQQLKAL